MLAAFFRKLKNLFVESDAAEDSADVRDQLRRALTELNQARLSGLPSKTLELALKKLCRQIGLVLESAGEPSASLEKFIPLLEELAGRLGGLVARPGAPLPKTEEEKLVAQVLSLESELRAQSALSAPATSSSSKPARLLPLTLKLRAAAEQLPEKKHLLAPEAWPSLEGIRASALVMLERMESEPQTARRGANFLEKYLGAAENVLDELEKLQRSAMGAEQLEQAQAQSGALLLRLEAAFQEEREALAAGDLLRFSADLAALDALLKIRGH